MRSWRLLGLALIIASSPANAAQADRLKELSDKLDANTLSADETREILRVLMRRALDAQPAAVEKPSESQAAARGDKVIAVYPDRNTTQLVIEARRPLVAGSLLYAGPEELQITLDDLMARSGDLYYYSASTPGKPRIRENDAVVSQRARKIETPSVLKLKIQEIYDVTPLFMPMLTVVLRGIACLALPCAEPQTRSA